MNDNRKSEVGSQKSDYRNQILVSLLIIIIDHASKFFARRQFANPKIFENPSLPFDISLPGDFNFVVVLAIFIIFVWLYFRYLASPRTHWAFAFITGGALSNILERLGRGFVTDFLNLGITTVNLADLAIMIGIVLIARRAIRNSKS